MTSPCFRYLLVVALACLVFGGLPENIPAQTLSPDCTVFGLGMTSPGDNQATIVFSTSQPIAATIALWHDGKAGPSVTESQAATIHRAPFQGLVAGQAYEVRINAQAGNPPFTFTAGKHLQAFDRLESKLLLGVQSGMDPQQLKELGVQVVRYQMTWDNVEPARGQWNQQNIQRMVSEIDGVRNVGIEPVFNLAYCVPWAQTETSKQMTWRHKAFGPPDDLADWKAYVEKVMTTLKGKVHYYEVWNEPDAGYLASGKPAERADVANTPQGASPYVDNNEYWLGDRYVPLVIAVREIADKIDPGIHVIAASWNHDYGATRGQIIFKRGVQDYIQQYSFHNYIGAPHSFARWQAATDKYFSSANRVFRQFGVAMPIAVTEWGTQTYDTPAAGAGFASRQDGQAFLVKSVFYYLALQDVSMLILHKLGYDDEYSLLLRNPDGSLVVNPMYYTYQWLCHTLGGKPYRLVAAPGGEDPSQHVVAVELTSTHELYLAAWQDKFDGAATVTLPARKVTIQLQGVHGRYLRQALDLQGNATAKDSVPDIGQPWELHLPADTGTSESAPVIFRLTPATNAAGA